MKIKVKTDYDGCSYITAGRVYEAEVLANRIQGNPEFGYLLWLIDDEEDKIFINELDSIHLNGHNWQVLEES